MNKTRRKELENIFDIISSAQEQLEVIRDDEEEYKENIPENLQNSIRYETAEVAVDAIESALFSIQEVLDYIEEAKQ